MFKTLLHPLITCFRPRLMKESSSTSNNPPSSGRSEYRDSTAVLNAATNALTEPMSTDLTSVPFVLDQLSKSDQTSLQLLRTLTQINKVLRTTVTQHSNKWKCLGDIHKACESLNASDLPPVNAVLDTFSDEWTPEKLANPKNRTQFQRILHRFNEAETKVRRQQHEERLSENQMPGVAVDNGFRQWVDALINQPTSRENRANISYVWNRNETFGLAWCEAEYKIQKDNFAFNGLPEALRNNKDLLMIALQESAHPIEHADLDCRRDIDIMMQLARAHHFSWVEQYADISIRKELLQRCAAENIPTR